MSFKINHELELVFIHLPKNGGNFITDSLLRYYNFEMYESQEILKNENNNIRIKKRADKLIESGYNFLLSTNLINYKFFCVVRNPYERFISAFEYLNLSKYEIFTLKDCILNMENFKKGLVNNLITDLNAYVHLFVRQTYFIKNIPNLTILHFENLNENFCDFLLKNGIKEIKHENIVLNKTNYKINFWEYYDSNTLTFVNNYFDEDFKKFGFKKYDNILDFYYNMKQKYKPYKLY
jgi:hypothetical protein